MEEAAGAYRDEEGQCLAGACLGRAQHIPAGQRVRQRGALDGSQVRVLGCPEPLHGVARQRQILEGGQACSSCLLSVHTA